MSIVTIRLYKTSSDRIPFSKWLESLDSKTRAIIRARLARIRLQDFGDCKMLKNANGIWEMRIKFGAGYRIYFGKKGDQIVILLCGGDKGTQDRDIEKAKRYWEDYQDE